MDRRTRVRVTNASRDQDEMIVSALLALNLLREEYVEEFVVHLHEDHGETLLAMLEELEMKLLRQEDPIPRVNNPDPNPDEEETMIEKNPALEDARNSVWKTAATLQSRMVVMVNKALISAPNEVKGEDHGTGYFESFITLLTWIASRPRRGFLRSVKETMEAAAEENREEITSMNATNWEELLDRLLLMIQLVSFTGTGQTRRVPRH